jgi:hypothetical protein
MLNVIDEFTCLAIRVARKLDTPKNLAGREPI